MNDFQITKCDKCGKWHPRALTCVNIALQEQAREAFDEWFYAHYLEMKRKERMHLDVVQDGDLVVFNGSPEGTVDFLQNMAPELRTGLIIWRGQNLQQYTVAEYFAFMNVDPEMFI